MTALAILAAWLAASIPAALLVCRAIRLADAREDAADERADAVGRENFINHGSAE